MPFAKCVILCGLIKPHNLKITLINIEWLWQSVREFFFVMRDLITNIQWQGSWWPGDVRSQYISCHGINHLLIRLKYTLWYYIFIIRVPFHQHKSTKIRAWGSDYIHGCLWNVIIHPHWNLNCSLACCFELRALVTKLYPIVLCNDIIYLCPRFKTG